MQVVEECRAWFRGAGRIHATTAALASRATRDAGFATAFAIDLRRAQALRAAILVRLFPLESTGIACVPVAGACAAAGPTKNHPWEIQ
jgi:hypothetical protein